MAAPERENPERVEIELAEGLTLQGLHYRANAADSRPRPLVIFVHGIGLTADSRPVPSVAAALNDRGIDLLAYDPEGFGHSEPRTPALRGVFEPRRQCRELRAVVAWARQHLDGVAEDRIGLLGYSYGGSYAILVASEPKNRIKSVATRSPFVAGLEYVGGVTVRSPIRLARIFGRAIHDATRAARRRTPRYVAIADPKAKVAVFVRKDAEAYLQLVGPSWRNEIAARFAALVAFHRQALGRGRRLRRPLLVTIGARDGVASPGLAASLVTRRSRRRPTRALVILEGADHFAVNLSRIAEKVARAEAHWFVETL